MIKLIKNWWRREAEEPWQEYPRQHHKCPSCGSIVPNNEWRVAFPSNNDSVLMVTCPECSSSMTHAEYMDFRMDRLQ